MTDERRKVRVDFEAAERSVILDVLTSELNRLRGDREQVEHYAQRGDPCAEEELAELNDRIQGLLRTIRKVRGCCGTCGGEGKVSATDVVRPAGDGFGTRPCPECAGPDAELLAAASDALRFIQTSGQDSGFVETASQSWDRDQLPKVRTIVERRLRQAIQGVQD